MALPTVAINSTGSDIGASGAGPSVALTGTLAATHTNTTVNITDGADLSGVAVDGSAALWVSSSSGRQWSGITGISGSVGAWTVTVADAYANTESGKTWGIGGKRATLAGSIQLGLDVRAGWTIDVQTNQTLTANFSFRPNAVQGTTTTFKSSVGSATAGTGVQISTATNSIYGLDVQNGNCINVRNIYFKCTAGTPGSGVGPVFNAGSVTNIAIYGCVFDGWLYAVRGEDPGGNVQTVGLIVAGCEIKSCTTGGILVGNKGAIVEGNYIHGNTGNAVDVSCSQTPAPMSFIKNVVTANAGVGLRLVSNSGNMAIIARNNTVGNNTGAGSYGIFLHQNGSGTSFDVRDNVSYGNTAADIQVDTSLIDASVIDYNFYGTTGGSYVAGANDVTLSASPWTSSSDFGLNSTAGGGAACKGLASVPPNASANTAGDPGAIPSGSGGATPAAVFPVPTGKTTGFF